MDAMIVYGAAAGGAFVGLMIGAMLKSSALGDAAEAHVRAAGALATLRARVDRALASETPGAAPAAKRLCRILRGEE